MKRGYDVQLICDYDTTNDWWFMDERERDLWGDDRETYCLGESDVYDIHDNDNSLCHLSDEELSEMLVGAIKDNNFGEIQRLVELNDISPNVCGCKPLEAAVETGNLELLKYLVEWGGNVNGTALLEVAIDNGEYDILCYLAPKVKKEKWEGILEKAVRAKKNALDMTRFLVNIVGLNVTVESLKGSTDKRITQILEGRMVLETN